MSTDSRDQFEQAYSEDNGGLPVEFLKLDRLGESYGTPKVARAWYWWKRARAGIVIELPVATVSIFATARDAKAAQEGLDMARVEIEAAGMKVES